MNDVADRDFDRHVKRTAQRPVTSGALPAREALALGAVLALAAFALVLTVNRTAVLWSFAALAISLAYPFAKRFVSLPQAVLGVAFSFGIPMAFAAVQAAVPAFAWMLLAGNLFWVLAYDTEYAMVDRDDDLLIGMKTSAITFGRFDVAAVMVSYAVYLIVWAAAGIGESLSPVFLVAIAAGSLQALWHWQLIRERTPRRLLQGLSAQPLARLDGCSLASLRATRFDERRGPHSTATQLFPNSLGKLARPTVRRADCSLELLFDLCPVQFGNSGKVVPPLDVTRSRKTDGVSSALLASADAPVKVPTARR